jgi:alkylation response protein AidB-like acyl-CoA dehydrogenase
MTGATRSPAAREQGGPAEGEPQEFLLSPEQREFGTTLRAYLQERFGHEELRRSLEADSARDEEAWRLIAVDLALPAALVPAEYGGLGFGALEAMVIAQEMGRVLYRSPWLATCVLAATAVLAAGGSEAPAPLSDIASGRSTAALADDALVTTRARAAAPAALPAANGGHVLNGSARFVLDGATAEHLFVLAHDDAGGSLYRIEGRDRVSTESLETLDLTRPVAALTFNAAPATRIGDPGAAPLIRQTVGAVAGLASAAEALGGMERCLDMGAQYAKTRFQFGRPIGSFQAVKHKLADLLVRVEFTRTAVQHAAWSVATSAPDAALAVHAAQAQASDSYLSLTADNIQVHGGIGFTYDHDAHLYFRRAKGMHLMFGSPAFHRERIADLVGI